MITTLSSVLWCPFRFSHKNDVRFVFIPSCLCYLCLFAYCGAQYALLIWITWRVCYQRQELITHHEYLGSPMGFGGVCVAHLLSFLCCVFFCLRSVSCVPYVASFSGFFILDCLSSFCVLCTISCQFLWIIHSWLLFRVSRTFVWILESFFCHVVSALICYV
jgi:hypothetical protein